MREVKLVHNSDLAGCQMTAVKVIVEWSEERRRDRLLTLLLARCACVSYFVVLALSTRTHTPTHTRHSPTNYHHYLVSSAI